MSRSSVPSGRFRSQYSRRVVLEALERRDLLASYTTPEDTRLVVSDPAFVAATIAAQPLHGKVFLTATGGFAYEPALNYHGPDRFLYFVASTTTPSGTPSNTDPTTSVPGVVQEVALTVTPVNDAPVARGDQYSVRQDVALTIEAPGVLKNDSDVDNNAFSAKPDKQPEHGTLKLNENGSFVYTPVLGYTGPDKFTYVANDGSAVSVAATVSLFVSPARPDARDDQVSVLQNTSTTIAPRTLLANDVPVTDFGLIASLEPGEVNVPKHGTVKADDNGNFVYTPATGYFGPDSFVYRATDATPFGNALPPAFDLARVWIYVRPVATAVVANDDSYSTLVGKKLEIGSPGVLKNDHILFAAPTDPASSNTLGTSPIQFPLRVEVAEQPEHGTVTLKPEGGFVYIPDPIENYVGLDTFTYKATLQTNSTGGTIGGVSLSDTATVTIEIKPLPLPVAHDDFYRMLEGTKLNIAATNGVLRNDLSVENRGIVASLAQGPVVGTLVAFNADGSFTYEPPKDFSGYVSFTYHALHENTPPPTPLSSDNGTLPPRPINLGTVRIYVQDANPPVYARDDFYSTLINTPLPVEPPGVLGNDSLIAPPAILVPHAEVATTAGTTEASAPIPEPPFKITLNAKLLTGPKPEQGVLEFSENGSFTFVPEEGFSGAVTFTYEATATVSAEVDPSDPSIGAAVGVEHLAPCILNSDGTAICPPVPDLDNIATVTIYVRLPEPAPGPVARNDFFLIAANTKREIRKPGVLANDYVRGIVPLPAENGELPAPGTITDPPIRPILYAVLVSGPGEGNGELSLHSDGSFSYTPKEDFVGDVTFTYRASLTPPAADAAGESLSSDALPILSDIATVTIRVVRAVAHGDSYSTLQGTELKVEAPGVLGNDDGGSETQPLKAALLRGPLHGTVELKSDGSFIYVPKDGYVGPDLFTYRAGDGSVVGEAGTTPTTAATNTGSGIPPLTTNAVDVGFVKIYVRPKTPEVKANDDKFAARKNTTLTIAAPGVLANDLRPANVALMASIVERPIRGTLELKADGGFTYVPETDFVGEIKFAYRASLANSTGTAAGSLAGGSVAIVTIYVLAEDQLPKFIPGGNQTATDESGEQKIADWATLVSIGTDGRPANFAVTTDKPQLFAAMPSIDATGQLVFTPAPNVSGTARVTVSMEGETGEGTSFDIQIDKPHPLFNAAEPCDVNGDLSVVAGDALDIINYLNARGSTPANLPEGEAGAVTYYDVDGDGAIAPSDALAVINFLNAGLAVEAGPTDQPEGEHAAATDLSILALTAEDAGGSNQRRRRSL